MIVSPATREHEALVVRVRAAGCVFAEDEAAMRIAGLPLEQVLGRADFCGMRVAVRPGVFVPRRRTGHLVHTAAAVTRPGAVVLDLCCGTGAIGLAVRSLVGEIELHASDLDPAACGQRPAHPRGSRPGAPGRCVRPGPPLSTPRGGTPPCSSAPGVPHGSTPRTRSPVARPGDDDVGARERSGRVDDSGIARK